MRKLSFILLFSAICFSCGNNNKSPKTSEEIALNSTQVEESKKSNEPELIKAGDELITQLSERRNVISIQRNKCN